MSTKPSLVFCHGILADGSCFSKVMPTFQAEGHEVISAQYGLDNNVADVAATQYYLGQVSSPAILIGHSYGGAVITAAGTDDRVTGLVYIAAVAPDADETTQSLISKFPETALFRHVKVASGRIWMPHDATADFCGDLSEAEQQLVWATATPPSTELLSSNAPGVGLEDQAELVHRRQQRQRRQPRAGALRGQAHEGHHL
jgi:pimeloyl-ACP methyl ester carboxylesterase